ncbi:hypothetical protein BJP25_28565 [Actinokineospora bangkokensis]|uniref:MerR family transcriptional regulator n=1 Tax=Actinokineospora bangkokensis TaxID=1193682 RepID=A0A1Q9LGG5_9PSEU|nr:hypothetical protein BJP25_28565 [Actinokineospora bangkokensis]
MPVAAVARRLGVAPATLRTWDRRYGLGPRGHTTGRHRRYTAADLARLELMRRALLKGATPAEAAGYALRVADDPAALADPAPPVPAQSRAAPPPGGGPEVAALARAVLAMDDAAVGGALAAALAGRGALWVWDELVGPVLAAVGVGWAHPADRGTEVAHLLAECVLTEFVRATPRVAGPAEVLLCCAPGERYGLPLHVLRAALAERGVAVRTLGAAVPVPALVAAVRRTAPAAVVVWAHATAHADPSVLRALPAARPRPLVVAGGPGWAGEGLSPRVEHLAGVGDVVARVVTVSPGVAHSPRE